MTKKGHATKRKGKGKRRRVPSPITPEALTCFADLFGELQKEIANYSAYLPKKKKRLLDSLWHSIYDEPYSLHLAIVAHCFGLEEKITEALHADDPAKELLSSIEEEDIEALSDRYEKNEKLKLAFSLCLLSLIKNTESMAVNGMSINALLDDGLRGNDKSYFKAVKIDPTVMYCEKFNRRVRQAVLDDDRQFWAGLSNAIKPSSKKKIRSYLSPVRMVVLALLETGQLQQMSRRERKRLLIDHLRFYQDQYNLSHAPDSAEALNKFIYRTLTKKVRQQFN